MDARTEEASKIGMESGTKELANPNTKMERRTRKRRVKVEEEEENM